MIAPFWTGLSVLWFMPSWATYCGYIAFTHMGEDYAPYCPIKWETI